MALGVREKLARCGFRDRDCRAGCGRLKPRLVWIAVHASGGASSGSSCGDRARSARAAQGCSGDECGALSKVNLGTETIEKKAADTVCERTSWARERLCAGGNAGPRKRGPIIRARAPAAAEERRCGIGERGRYETRMWRADRRYLSCLPSTTTTGRDRRRGDQTAETRAQMQISCSSSSRPLATSRVSALDPATTDARRSCGR